MNRIRRSVLLLFRGALLTGVVTAAGYRHLNSASAALLYLVAVVVQSLECSFWEAAVTSLLATSALDYFFIEPRLTFNVGDPLDGVTLAGLLIVSLGGRLTIGRRLTTCPTKLRITPYASL